MFITLKSRPPSRLELIQQHEFINGCLTPKQEEIRQPKSVKTEHVRDCKVSKQ